ncbi:MAG: TRAP transporter substrate-binding protein DctP [Verrucomicrobiales bacterium]|nr:TRAP transporter substrate-binding protein DctP [Verrucomicrobiales bacterium]MCP5525410.1 TRAP transporter substrate-binding protein DctP [Verrucomicrobiales bacterium]
MTCVRFRWLVGLVFAGVVLGCSAPLAKAATRIKLATLAPTGSAYHKSLMRLRDEWRQASNGSVNLVVYADGKLGGEADTVGLMGLNSIQASLLTAVGLSEIEPGAEGLQSIPMGFRDLAEVDFVGERLRPLLEQRLAAKGFVVLFWTDAGWVHFFTKSPVNTPDDLKRMKLFTWAGSPETVRIYKSAGFNVIPLETADILPSLQTGMIDAAPAPPVFALAGQVDTRAPHMLQVNWGPLVGACVVRKETWDAIPANLREAMAKSALEVGREIKELGRQESREAVQAMERRGLKVAKPTPEVEAQWRAAAEAVYPEIRGSIVPADVFDQAMQALKEYRAGAR